MKHETRKTLRLILGDQLNSQHTWFQRVDPMVTYVMMEVRSETDYATHHLQKVLGFFASMRQFALQLRQQQHQVIYLQLNDTGNRQRIDENCATLIAQHGFSHFDYLLPDEYRLDQHLQQFVLNLEISWACADTEHFYTQRDELKNLFVGKKTFLMESFYRYMRRKHHVLMDAAQQPLFGQWNFDAENRKKLPDAHRAPNPLLFDNDLQAIARDLKISGVKTIGSADAQHFAWPINRAQSLLLLSHFTTHCLPLFGTYQDAMSPYAWSLYHSRLSFSLNTKMLSPQEVVQAAIHAYEASQGKIAFHQLEGFIRQIIGWREYMRGIYWLHMPTYATLNYFDHQQLLPSWYWTGKTKMHCLSHTIQQSLTYGYAHHIQRLMVTGNFALLAGISPDDVDAWYLGIYVDAIEWVEITNTRGMSQFADGGIVGTKPYVSAAAYINKMSSYCAECFYDRNKKTGEGACPFNSLYWHFYHRHQDKLSKNPRIGMMYSLWQKMDPSLKDALLEQATSYLNTINEL